MNAGAPPQISIALSMYNAAATIERAVRSLLLQTFGDWELLVFDDGSTDDSVMRVRRFDDPRIRLVSDGRQLGLAARLNLAIELAQGRYLARADADDVVYPERLERQLAFLRAQPQIDLVGSGMMVFADDGRPIGLYPIRETHEAICARPYSGFYLAHPTWMGKTAWFRRWRYDPACRKAQDQDLLLRSYAFSRFAALPEPLIGYRQDSISVSKSLTSRYALARAIVRVSRRDRHYAAGAAALARQAAKFAVDAVAISSGLARRLQSHRSGACSAAQSARWREVWRLTDPGH